MTPDQEIVQTFVSSTSGFIKAVKLRGETIKGRKPSPLLSIADKITQKVNSAVQNAEYISEKGVPLVLELDVTERDVDSSKLSDAMEPLAKALGVKFSAFHVTGSGHISFTMYLN